MKVVAIIQARMGSTRLPNKVLMPLAGVPVIDRVYARASKIEGLTGVLVATSEAASDDGLFRHCTARGMNVFRGSEQDVLDRYYRAASSLNLDAVMRITGDCPFLDPIESGRVLEAFVARRGCDYGSNVEPPFLPDGLDTEVIRFSTLARIWREVQEPIYREHVTFYVREHRELFNVVNVSSAIDLSALRWTLDTTEDYAMLSKLADVLADRNEFGYLREVLAALEGRPDIASMNANLERDSALKLALAQMKASQP
jgi:spore coat polysaccharide biosynthesis protein SpsF (cytidylyltransferase family)